MKVLWEDKDIKPGRRFGKIGTSNGHGLIGYSLPPDGPKEYTLVALSDGLQFKSGTQADLAVVLNAGDYVPEELLNDDF